MPPFFYKRLNGVLGLNARSLEYTARVNDRAAIRLANNKLATKRVLQKAGIATPRLYARLASRSELRGFRWTKLPSSFVLKPNSASGGGGIVVIFGRNKKGNWVKGDQSEVFIPQLRQHVLDILDGSFSKSNLPDTAFFEQRVKIHADLKPYSVRGVPDVRILVYNNVPIMAMLRLPTEESGGRANLHAGGIGVGIDLVHGLTTTAIVRGHLIETMPTTRVQLSGIRIPHWSDVLLTAVRTARAAGLMYAGIDVAIDRDDGPLVLETNARPGLEIQFANLAPLKTRLRRVEGLTVSTPEKGVRLAKSLFGEEITHGIEDLSGRIVLGVEEEVRVMDTAGVPHAVLAKIDTGAYRTAIDTALAKRLNLHHPIIAHRGVRAALGREDRPVIELNFTLRGRSIVTSAFMADRTHMNYDIIIGRRDLQPFLVDPSRRHQTSSTAS